MIWVKTTIFTILAPGTVTILLPYCLLRIHQNPAPNYPVISAVIGLALIGMGLFIYLVCAWNFASAGKGTPAPLAPPKNLVAGSLYRISRNPMYIGIICILIGESIFFMSAILGGYTVIIFICFHLFVRYYEEPILSEKFGAEYIRYCREVPRWLMFKKSEDRSAAARRLPND